MIESDKKEFNNYMMFPFPFKAYWTFLTNIVYYVIVLFIVSILYGLVNEYIYNNIGVEPLLFGTFSLIIDMVFIGIKDLIVHIVKRNKNTKNNEVLDV
jgi:ABC-type multidrug transport system permease subunit